MSDRNTPSLVIADSHEIVREGIAGRLEGSCNVDVVGQAVDGYSTLKVCRQLNPDLLLMDLSLTRPSGLETLTRLRQIVPETRVVVLSSDASVSDAFTVLGMGAFAFMPKQAKGADLVNAVRAAISGFTCVPQSYLSGFVTLQHNVKRTGNSYGLSQRELEVLEACASGQTTKDVAQMFKISARTVETHRHAIYRKTDCHDLVQIYRSIQG